MEKKNQRCSYSQEEVVSEAKKNSQKEEIISLCLKQLVSFKSHPYKVEANTELFELMKSIEKDGILIPLLARPNPRGDGYELISGHRRKAACEWAGITKVPVIIRNLDDCQAIIAMVDSNLQRENIKPSEKAFAYRMKLEAMRQQGKRNDLTSEQVGPKLENPTVEVSQLKAGYDEKGNWLVESDINNARIRSNEILAKQIGESVNQIKRYIRLTYLVPKLLDMVDEGKIAFTVAVELSYLNEEEQYELHAVLDMEQCTPSLSQANRLKRMSQKGELDMESICTVLEERKPNQQEQIKIRSDRLKKYFPSTYTENQKVELIEKLVKDWHQKQLLKEKKIL